MTPKELYETISELVSMAANVKELADVPRQLRGLTPQDAYVYALRDVLDAERQARANNTFTVNYDAVRDRLRAANINFENLPLAAEPLNQLIGEQVAGLLLDEAVLVGVDLGYDVDLGWAKRLVYSAHPVYVRKLYEIVPEGVAERIALSSIASAQASGNAELKAKLDRLTALVEELHPAKEPTPPPPPHTPASAARPSQNPFVTGNAVPPEMFVGRTAALNFIQSRLGGHTLQSASIVAERRMGKSSLLRYVKERDSVVFSAPTVVVYLDLMAGYCHTRVGFIRALHRELTRVLGRAPWSATEPNDLVTLGFALEDLSREGLRLILALDEVEELAQRRREFDDVLETLRAAGSMGQLGLLTASRQPLADLCHSHNLISPFYNIFLQETFGLLEPAEWRGLVTQHLPATEADLQAIVNLAGGHPFYTQLAASRLHGDEPDWQQRALEDVRPLWADQWAHLTPAEQSALRVLAGLPAPQPIEPAVRHGLHRKGLLKNDNLFAPAYADWLRTR